MTQLTDAKWAQGPLRLDLLTGPVDPQLMAQFKASGQAPGNWAILGAVAGAIGGVFLGTIIPSGQGAVAMTIGLALAGALIIGLIVWAVHSYQLNKQFRMWAFAMANELTVVGSPRQVLPGMIFDIGGGRRYYDVLRSNTARPVEFGNYQYTTGSGKSQQTHHWGYMAITLDNVLPNIVLDAEGNNGFFGSNLPVALARNQRLSLEGDFDKYFRLFCPTGYERDALYLFTPDVMARFIDTASALDVEIVDNQVFFYMQRDMSTTDPATWMWLYRVIDTFLTKVKQWERWRDERLRAEAPPQQWQGQLTTPTFSQQGQVPMVPQQFAPLGTTPPNPWLGPQGVARGGQRLRRSFAWPVVVGAIAFVGFILLQVLTTFR